MAWSVQALVTEYEDIKNLVDAEFIAPLNEIETFRIIIDQPTTHQRTNYVEGLEISMSDGDVSIVGEVKKTSEGGDTLTLEGVGFSKRLDELAINATNTSSESSGTGYDVTYNGVAESTIVPDLISGTGLSMGTNEAAATLRYVRFKNTKILKGIRFMSELSGKDWSVRRTGGTKYLDFLTHKGSTAVTAYFELGVNADLIGSERDKTKYVTKCVVQGSGSATGSYDNAASPTVEILLKKPELQTSAECTAFATQYVTEFGDVLEYKNIRTPGKGVSLGDEIVLNGKGISEAQFRVVRYKSSYADPFKELYCVQTGKKTAKDDWLTYTRNLLKGVTEDPSVIDIGTAEATVSFSDRQNGSSTSGALMTFNIDSNQLVSPNKALLSFKRVNRKQDYGTATSSGTASISNPSHDAHAIGTYATTGAGGATTVQQSQSDASVTSGGDGVWADWGVDLDYPSSANAGMHVIISIQRSSASSAEFASFRLDKSFSSDYFPSSDGIKVPLSDSAGNAKSFATCHIFVPENTNGEGYEVQVKLDGLSASESGWSTYVTSYTIGQHTHPTTGASGSATTSISDTGHTNPLAIGATEADDGVDRDIEVYVDGSLHSTVSTVGLGDTNTVDVSADITTTGQHSIELRPAAGQVGLSMDITITGFKP